MNKVHECVNVVGLSATCLRSTQLAYVEHMASPNEALPRGVGELESSVRWWRKANRPCCENDPRSK